MLSGLAGIVPGVPPADAKKESGESAERVDAKAAN
jgi:hypothetical protein